MIKILAHKYMQLGGKIREVQHALQIANKGRTEVHPDYGDVSKIFPQIQQLCSELKLPVSSAVTGAEAIGLPETAREMEIMVTMVIEELKTQLFAFVPQPRAKYFELSLAPPMVAAFPSAASEIGAAGNSIAAGLYTASVFHSMRAVLIGLNAMATDLKVTFSYPIEFAEWGKIVGELEPKINAFKVGARSAQKDADLAFYSDAASQFRHFNNGWRIRVSHGRVTYEEPEAIKVLDHTISFFETLSTRLKE